MGRRPSSRRVVASVGLAAGVLAVLCVALLAGAAERSAGAGEATASAACPDVRIVGLRGSGEKYLGSEHGMGSLVGPVADLIKKEIGSSAKVEMVGIKYTAASAWPWDLASGKYFDSVDDGSSRLIKYVVQQAKACPSTKMVVMGYSQGAHVAGDVLSALNLKQVVSLVMFGDPRFNPDASYARGTFNPKHKGSLSPRSKNTFTSWSSRVFSFCNANDLVCQGVDKIVRHGTSQHKQELYLGNYGKIVAGLIRNLLGLPRATPAPTPLDLAFVIDTTGSMGSDIYNVAASADSIAANLDAAGADFRVGLVEYRDTDQGDAFASRVDVPMTRNVSAFRNGLNGLYADGGGDWEEAVYSGIMTAINDLDWRFVPRKAIIVMGDAPAKDPEPITGYTAATVLEAARNLDPATIYPVSTYYGADSSFQPLADGSGGELFRSYQSGDVAGDVIEAVNKAALPIYSSLTVTSPARPGTEVWFSALGSYYDLGDIVRYDWDFDGDGSVDESTPGARTSHVYTAPFEGYASVTVVTDDDNTRSTTASVSIRDDAPVAAGRPLGVKVRKKSKQRKIAASWSAPKDLGGGSLEGYEIRVDDARRARTVASRMIGPDKRKVVFGGLPRGRYKVRVSALTDAGAGQQGSSSALMLDPGNKCRKAKASLAKAKKRLAKSKSKRRGSAVAKAKVKKAKKAKKRSCRG